MSHTRFQHTAFLALGSNLGDRFGYLVNALRALNEHPQVRVVAASRIYETAPVGPVAQGAYLNACLQVQTDLCAIELLRTGLQIEAQNGRVRTQRFGPRTLDIDLLAHSGTHHIETPELVLPHPRLHERAFVLVPLADIAPQLQIAQNSVVEWLRKCPQSDIDDVRATALRLPVAQGNQSNLLGESAPPASSLVAFASPLAASASPLATPSASSPTEPASPSSAPSASPSAPLYHAAVPCPLDPEAVFLQLQGQRGCVWLDSARSNPQGDARHSLVAANPISRLRFTGGRLEQIDYATAKGGLQPTETLTVLPQVDPLIALEQWLALFGRKETQKPGQQDSPATAPAAAPAATDCAAAAGAALDFFAGGAIGYFSYEFGRQWERHNQLLSQTACLPQMDWALYDCAFIFDQLSKTGQIVACSLNSSEQALEKAKALAALLATGLQKDQCGTGTQTTAPLQTGADAIEGIGENRQSSPEKTESLAKNKAAAPASIAKENDDACDSAKRREAYVAAVEKVRDYIAAGDIYQVNIAQHFKAPLQESPADLYLRLRRLNPAPYAAYLDTGAYQILSSSPELFLQKKGRSLCTRPIKGTRPRGKDAMEDARLCKELLDSEKERAELLMIVDLERNDLGRVCEPGSVQVQSLYRIESYATVHHLVADVCGTLRAQTGLAELLRATFPGGSITGAPKVRAMEIIDELEQQERGIFCGAIGLIGLNDSLNLNIAIRTLLCSQQVEGGRQVHVSVGAGLVWDSDPQQEYEETLHKAEALLKAIHSQPPPLL